MRYIFMTLIFCYGSITFANVCWQAPGKPDPNPAYASKKLCEEKQNAACFNFCGKDPRKWMVGQVDDETQPIFRSPELSPVKLDCQGFADCQDKVSEDGGACTGEENTSAKWDELSNWPDVTGVAGPWFIWCEKVIGFEQKPALVPDPDGIAAVEAQEAQQAARAQARAQRVTTALGCVDAVNGGGTLTQPQIRDCINSLVKEVFESQISTDDL